ncbi:hypothetical protein TNCV_596021 [Trichonephila clavipes]|uniref:Uncharacterized protein n=1 Tax=Trichonephila clavipes TaxID=2585209 RepID=A0A8X6UTM9_TRICX|nr:hypothetical protein TNCV_596021 [Trichonephila clavipes]
MSLISKPSCQILSKALAMSRKNTRGLVLGKATVNQLRYSEQLNYGVVIRAEIVKSDTMVERNVANTAKSMTLRTADAIGGVWQSAVRLISLPEGRELAYAALA